MALFDSQFNGTIQGALNGTNIQVHLPDLAMNLGITNFSVKADDVLIQKIFLGTKGVGLTGVDYNTCRFKKPLSVYQVSN